MNNHITKVNERTIELYGIICATEHYFVDPIKMFISLFIKPISYIIELFLSTVCATGH